MSRPLVIALLALGLQCAWAADGPRLVQPPYEAPKVVYEFYLDKPQKIDAALDWLRALILPLTEPPYSFAPRRCRSGSSCTVPRS